MSITVIILLVFILILSVVIFDYHMKLKITDELLTKWMEAYAHDLMLLEKHDRIVELKVEPYYTEILEIKKARYNFDKKIG